MSKKWPFKKSPGVVVTALIEDVEELQDEMTALASELRDVKQQLGQARTFCATHTHRTYWPHPVPDDGLGDIGPVL